MKKRQVTVSVSGAFDPIHVGHIRHLRDAAKLGDRLVVILNSDDFSLRKKGFVFMPFAERKEILESIKGVDEVIACVDEDQTVCKTLELIKPQVFAKGGDRIGPENIPEAETCRKIGCKLVVDVGGEKIESSSELPRKIKELGIEDTHKLRVLCPYCADHPILKEQCEFCKHTGKIEVSKSDLKGRLQGR
jgi:cytidyltransferase-like protein